MLQYVLLSHEFSILCYSMLRYTLPYPTLLYCILLYSTLPFPTHREAQHLEIAHKPFLALHNYQPCHMYTNICMHANSCCRHIYMTYMCMHTYAYVYIYIYMNGLLPQPYISYIKPPYLGYGTAAVTILTGCYTHIFIYIICIGCKQCQRHTI